MNDYFICCKEIFRMQRQAISTIIEISQQGDDYILTTQTHEDLPKSLSLEKLERINRDYPFTIKKLEKASAKKIISKASKTQLTLMPYSTSIGFDGTFYDLWLANGLSCSHFSWWNECPQEWKPLEELWDLIIESTTAYMSFLR